jgi:hypothetical protein
MKAADVASVARRAARKVASRVAGRGRLPRSLADLREYRDVRRRLTRALRHAAEPGGYAPHPLYSVFTQYDRSHYLARRKEFLRKYRTFWAVARTVRPRVIVELGTAGGSGADAYLQGAGPGTHYVGYDLFGVPRDEETGEPWESMTVARALLDDRGHRGAELVRADLRALSELPLRANLAVVDAAHDYVSARGDTLLALTSNPDWLWVDDYALEVERAVREVLARPDVRPRVAFAIHTPYLDGGGLLVRLRRRSSS